MSDHPGPLDPKENAPPEAGPSRGIDLSRRRFLKRGAVTAGAILGAGPIVRSALGAELVPGDDGEVVGYLDTPYLPWAPEYRKHDPNRPWPTDVTPGEPCCPDNPAFGPPSDAIVLFDGSNMDAWEPNEWEIENGEVVAYEDDITTLESFGDCQLHLEWQAPDPPRGSTTDRGNSGVFFMSRYEIQIFDSYTEKIYPDGIAGAVYGETPPMVHPIRPPGQWNVYDITFTAPVFNGDGDLVSPARVTMLFNGVLVHNNTTIHGPTDWREISEYSAHPPEQPLRLQEHGNPVRFRNIWIRRLNLRNNNG